MKSKTGQKMNTPRDDEISNPQVLCTKYSVSGRNVAYTDGGKDWPNAHELHATSARRHIPNTDKAETKVRRWKRSK